MVQPPMVVTSEVEQAVGGQHVFIPDAVGNLWILWRVGNALNLTMAKENNRIDLTANRGEGGGFETSP